MLLDVELVVELLDGDLMDGHVGAHGHGADAVEDALGRCGARHGVHDDVGGGQKPLHRIGCGHHDLLRPLEGEVAREADGEIDEVLIAGAAHADALHIMHAVDAGELAHQVAMGLLRGGIEQSVDGLACELPAGEQDDDGDDERGDGIGKLQAGKSEVRAGPGGDESEKDGGGGPDVGAEVDGVGLQRGAAVAPRHTE